MTSLIFKLPFALCCAIGVMALTQMGCSSTPTDALQVEATPHGQMTDDANISLRFDQPMVSDDAVGTAATLPVTISPTLNGQWKWTDVHTAVFVPSAPLAPATQYQVHLANTVTSVAGKSPAEDYRFSVYASPVEGTLSMSGNRQRAVPTQQVSATFNVPVAFSQLKSHCAYRTQGARVDVERADGMTDDVARRFVLVPQTPLALDAKWVFRCDKALRGTNGNMGMTQDIELTFRTYGPLRFATLDPSGNDVVPTEDQQLKLIFSNPLDTPARVSISPKVAGFPARCHTLGGDQPGLACDVMLEAQTTYTVTVGKQQTDVFGQSLGKGVTATFRTSDAAPTISMDSGYFVAELTRPVVPIWTRNVSRMSVRGVKITPDTFYQLRPELDWWGNEPADLKKAGFRPKEIHRSIDAPKNAWSQESFDPATLYNASPGPGTYYLEFASPDVSKGRFRKNGREKVLVNFTNIGVVSKISAARGLVFASRLSSGDPLSGARVEVRTHTGQITWKGTTNGDGVAMLPPRDKLLGDTTADAVREYHHQGVDIFVFDGSDWTMSNSSRSGGIAIHNFGVNAMSGMTPVQLRGFMHTDRGVYRPGETVRVKGIVRESRLATPMRVPNKKRATVTVSDPRGNTLLEEAVTVSGYGGFWLDIPLAEDARLGDYSMRAEFEHGSFFEHFQVEAFKAATFEVDNKTRQRRIVRQGTLDTAVSANYFYGAPMGGGEAEVTVHLRPHPVRFDDYGDYHFGERLSRYDGYHSSMHGEQLLTDNRITLDDQGTGEVQVTLGANDVLSDGTLLIRSRVTSSSNERNQKTTTVPYYRYRRYFGIRAGNTLMTPKQKQTLKVVALTPSGKATTESARVTIKHVEWNCVWEDWGYRGSYRCHEERLPVLEKDVTFEGKPVDIDFVPEQGGDYLVEVKGDKGYQATASTWLYAWGTGGTNKSEDSMRFEIIADKKEYKDNDTAYLALRTDMSQATALVTIERDGIIDHRVMDIDDTATQLEIPIQDAYAPNIYVSVILIQGRMGEGRRGKPRLQMGMVNLPVRPAAPRLTVTVTPDKTDYLPGTPVTATVAVTDTAGNPVQAEVSVMAADEGVLSLTGFRTPDPVPTFYAPWGCGVNSATQYGFIRNIPGPNLERPATGGDSAALGTVRSRMLSTAVWKPGLVTDAAGTATVTFDAPDNLTAFRLMAVAADRKERFGSGDQRFTVSKPLQLHSTLPRFMRVGDHLRAGVMVHNETDKDGEATVTVVTDDAVRLNSDKRQTVAVKKGAKVPVSFDIEALMVGDASLVFRAAMGSHEDGVAIPLPIQHPSGVFRTEVAFDNSDAPVEMKIPFPSQGDPGEAEVVIAADGTGMAGLGDSLAQLIGYPYGCLEQTTSKVIPMVALKRMVASLGLAHLSVSDIDRFVTAGIAKIGQHQTFDGGFSLWPGGASSAYYSAYALWGLHLAKEAGYPVDAARMRDGLAYLKSIAHSDDSPSYGSRAGTLGSQVFALHVRRLLGDTDIQSMLKLLDEIDMVPLYGKAILLTDLANGLGQDADQVHTLAKELRRVADDAIDQKSLISEPRQAELGWYMSDAFRTTAMVLDSLTTIEKTTPRVRALAALLLRKQRQTRYLSTQARIYSLLALSRYSDMITQTTPTVSISMNDTPLGNARLDSQTPLLMVRAPLPTTGARITINPDGIVFYQVQVHYRKKRSALRSEDNGVTLRRRYLNTDGEKKRHFKVGDEVQVELTLSLAESQAHLIVSDPVPAGFEILNTRLATVSAVGVEESHDRDTFREIHDDRVDFATEYAWKGDHLYRYTIRAIAEGRYSLPPTVGEVMYTPEINGTTGIEEIQIRPR